MRLATTTGDFDGYASSSLEAMEYICESGFRYIDYNFCEEYRRKSGIFGDSPSEHIAEVKAKAAALGVRLVQAHAPMGRPLLDGGELARDTARCIEACSEWGIENLVVHSGYAPGLTRAECFAKNRDFFLPLCELGDRLGVNILVENFNIMCIDGTYWIDNAPDLCEFIDLVGHPRLRAVWDAGHGNMQPIDPECAVKMLGDRLVALHVQDNHGKSDEHIAPFFGTLDLDSLMRGLLAVGYRGYFTFEACRILPPGTDESRGRLYRAPLSVKLAAEKLLYEIGRAVLSEYGCLEE